MYDGKYLTKKVPRLDDSGEWQNIAYGVGIQEIIDRLAEYEDAEKRGRLTEVRYGRWQFEIYENMPWCTKAICTSCKQVIANNADLTQTWGKDLFLHDNLYCPRCGAKMDGGQDE